MVRSREELVQIVEARMKLRSDAKLPQIVMEEELARLSEADRQADFARWCKANVSLRESLEAEWMAKHGKTEKPTRYLSDGGGAMSLWVGGRMWEAYEAEVREP